MELLLKNVRQEHLSLLTELAKTLYFDIEEAIEDDAYYLSEMKKGEEDGHVLSDEEFSKLRNELMQET